MAGRLFAEVGAVVTSAAEESHQSLTGSQESIYSLRKRKRTERFLSGRANAPHRLNRSLEGSFNSQLTRDDSQEDGPPTHKKRESERRCCCSVPLKALAASYQAIAEHPAKTLQYRRVSYKPKGNKQHYRNVAGKFVVQNQWIRENLLDGHGNYLFCLDCILAVIDVSKQRMHRQRTIKRNKNQCPVISLTKQEVMLKKLESCVLCPGPEMAAFNEWWRSLDDDSIVGVKYPYERHRLAGRPSNNTKNEVMSDFLDFVDANAQPNGRHSGSSSAQFFFLPKFTRIDPPRQIEKNYDEKLKTSVVAEFNRAQEERGRGTCGKTAASTWLKQHRPKVALHPSMTDYCDTCKILKEKLSRNQAVYNRLLQSGNASVAELQQLQREKEQYEADCKAHKENATKSREYYKEVTKRCTDQWGKISKYLQKPNLSADERRELNVLQHCFTIVLSADYQQAKLIPFWGATEQPGSTYYLQKVSIDIFGITDHRDNTGKVDLFDERIGPKNTDHTVSLLTRYWESVVAAHPWLWRLMIFLDNATSTNKNWYLFTWAMEMVRMGKVDFIHLSFLLAGHTKFSPDRLFATIANAYKKADVFTIGELEDLCSPYATTCIEDGTHILTWRETLGKKYSDLPGVRNLHDFLIVKGQDGEVVMKVRKFCFGGTWKMSPLHCKDAAVLGVPAECDTYKDKCCKPISHDKMTHMVTMYDKFISPARRPEFLPPLSHESTSASAQQSVQQPTAQTSASISGHTGEATGFVQSSTQQHPPEERVTHRRKGKCTVPGCTGEGHRNKARWHHGHTTKAGCPKLHKTH